MPRVDEDGAAWLQCVSMMTEQDSYEVGWPYRIAEFGEDMKRELIANVHKGGREHWMHADPDALLHDITWHWAKLATVMREINHLFGRCLDPAHCDGVKLTPAEARDQAREYTADIANCAFLLWDRLSLDFNLES